MKYYEQVQKDMETAKKTLEQLCVDHGIDIEKIPELKDAFGSAMMEERAKREKAGGGTEDINIDIVAVMAAVVKRVSNWSRVKEIELTEFKPVLKSPLSGEFVSVRPVGDEFGGKTYLGIFLGELALGVATRLSGEKIEVRSASYNPAIFIPSQKKVVYGCESWWGTIKKPEDLEQITDTDIDNVWYVKAMKAQMEQEIADPTE